MTLNLSVASDLEQQLFAHAAALGQDVETFVLEAVRDRLAETFSPKTGCEKPLTTAKRISLLREWAADHARLPSEVDDRRERLYEDRGE